MIRGTFLRARAPGASDERGGIVTGWLLQVVVFMAVISFVAYEGLAILVTTVSLDDVARDVARSARDEYRVDRSEEGAREAAARTAATHNARVLGLTDTGEELVVELERDAPTLVVHRISAFQDLTSVDASARVRWAP